MVSYVTELSFYLIDEIDAVLKVKGTERLQNSKTHVPASGVKKTIKI